MFSPVIAKLVWQEKRKIFIPNPVVLSGGSKEKEITRGGRPLSPFKKKKKNNRGANIKGSVARKNPPPKHPQKPHTPQQKKTKTLSLGTGSKKGKERKPASRSPRHRKVRSAREEGLIIWGRHGRNFPTRARRKNPAIRAISERKRRGRSSRSEGGVCLTRVRKDFET